MYLCRVSGLYLCYLRLMSRWKKDSVGAEPRCALLGRNRQSDGVSWRFRGDSGRVTTPEGLGDGFRRSDGLGVIGPAGC